MKLASFRTGLALAAFALACGEGTSPAEQSPAARPSPGAARALAREPQAEPLDAVRRLLALYDLAAKGPAERGAAEKNKAVDRNEVLALVADAPAHDPFLVDLYTGFLAGVLSSSRNGLVVTRRGDTAEVAAGRLRVVLRLDGATWKIALAESVPDEIKARALMAKESFERATRVASRTP